MDDWQAVLRSEFDAVEGSFLLKMRGGLAWDVEAFERVITAMEACCHAKEGEECVERWMTEGFWYFSWAVKDWTSHPNFPRYRVAEYYEKSYEYLIGLATWFFDGVSPWINDGETLKDEIGQLKYERTHDHLKN